MVNLGSKAEPNCALDICTYQYTCINVPEWPTALLWTHFVCLQWSEMRVQTLPYCWHYFATVTRPKWVSLLVLWAQSTKKDYIRAEHKLHSISKLFISQVIIPQVMIFFSLFTFRGHPAREPASSRVTYFNLRAYTGSGVSHSQHKKKIGRGFGKMQVNGPEG